MNQYLEKIAGNRLIRHIAENRQNFPLSRLTRMADSGVIKSPEQLLPGRNLGAVNQFNATAKKHGMAPVEGPADTFFASSSVAKVDRGINPGGQYRSLSLKNEYGHPIQQTVVPALYPPVPGDHVANIKRLHDTHVNNHETFEMDEAFRMMGRGRTSKMMGNTLPSEAFKTESHHNPAVLLRESRDMSSNPYAHISPAATEINKYRKVSKATAKSGGDLKLNSTNERVAPLDVSAAIPTLREGSKESVLVQKLQSGRPYQSNPTSSEIRRSRNMLHADSQAILDDARGGVLRKAKTLAQQANDIARGNAAYRN